MCLCMYLVYEITHFNGATFRIGFVIIILKFDKKKNEQ